VILDSTHARIGSFRSRLLVGMMIIIALISATVLYFAQQKVAADAEHAFVATYESELNATRRLHELRHAALTERCRALVRRPRIHAALEDNALDLLYSSAQDELLDVLMPADDEAAQAFALRATFYRFLDARGKVITPMPADEVGQLSAEEEASLALSELPQQQQIGYLRRSTSAGRESVDEVIAAPIISTETNEVIAAIVLGFKASSVAEHSTGVQRGLWLKDRLFSSDLTPASIAALARVLPASVTAQRSIELDVLGQPQRVFFTALNPTSLFEHACEVSFFPLAAAHAHQQQLRWQILSAGALLLLGGLVASHFFSTRLSQPIEALAEDSEVNRSERLRAETELQQTNVELQRSMRFTADASHQLKTPITVLRAGLEELLQHPSLSPAQREDISRLIYQTARLTSMTHDLLLLARVEAGRLELALTDVDLTALMDSLADDLSALPEAPVFDVRIAVPRGLRILGEKRYIALILQNLLENAWKYNQAHGRIAITAAEDACTLVLTIGNSGPGIPQEAQAYIFERFHRGNMGENIPGHGLGLNLARELARLHGGDLRLVFSTSVWTEFEVRLPLAPVA
jgi:signal transduction histidine kinase